MGHATAARPLPPGPPPPTAGCQPTAALLADQTALPPAGHGGVAGLAVCNLVVVAGSAGACLAAAAAAVQTCVAVAAVVWLVVVVVAVFVVVVVVVVVVVGCNVPVSTTAGAERLIQHPFSPATFSSSYSTASSYQQLSVRPLPLAVMTQSPSLQLQNRHFPQLP